MATGEPSRRKRSAIQHQRLAAKHAAKAEHHRKRAAHLGPERRRPEVLDAALELFLEHGYDGTSMQAVADEAGVTKPVVYACFAGKDELFRALLAREEQRILGRDPGRLRERRPLRSRDHPDRGLHRLPAGRRRLARGLPADLPGGGRRQRRGRPPDPARPRGAGEAAHAARQGLARGERDGKRRRPIIERTARLLGNSIAGLAESGARLLLSGEDGWTPETLGRELGRIAAAAQAAA